jgi:hypothetical protein
MAVLLLQDLETQGQGPCVILNTRWISKVDVIPLVLYVVCVIIYHMEASETTGTKLKTSIQPI